MDLASNYEIAHTAQFIHARSFTRVALQFPDDLLKDSTTVVTALQQNLQSLKVGDDDDDDTQVAQLFVMADTTYGSCCVDEVGASHVDADCVVHYGHTCLSPPKSEKNSNLNSNIITSEYHKCSSSFTCLVLYGLEYSHAIHHIKEAVIKLTIGGSKRDSALHYANIIQSVMDPSEDDKAFNGQLESYGSAHGSFDKCKQIGVDVAENRYVRYDPVMNHLVKDMSQQKKILMRRYYLVEKAKDSNIIGILVGTLGVAGYRRMIHQMKELITQAGKKAYTLVMGKPNPAKLANFPECDIFIYVSCAQTALFDSKEFLAPVITPFEATLAFNRGSQWMGSYVLEFQDLIGSFTLEVNGSSEARFSFFKGGYVEDVELQANGVDEEERATTLAEVTQKALQVRDKYSNSIDRGIAESGVEFFSARSYHGLDMQNEDPLPRSFVVGRTGKASGYYEGETNK
ncbi:hypothetical protein IFM89_018734 [Coptis chinensis]|uniref:2-(3-amino-3-carboxypropyl)histidine synthase subunit 2 n=1 Tax=Coptis chinensis TaxID=261450 RepID=A0A835HKI1_9MAGN|nr:hypothetical protein IFM89_018734 [Coptis chinensis]